ncbi:FG-GAP-like repeat-containing protein [Mesorhizobium sp. RIZ17]|uniref:FG-GAP-like repeat-containing protein n=1 Tax=Mesorhizobium sp. RIZ17 TaxID=3132743 RepID=UPI003DA7E210
MPFSNTTYTINPAAPTLTNSDMIQYTVTFSEAVTGVDVSQFALTNTGAVTGDSIASVAPIAGSDGTQYTVTIATGTGDGSVALAFVGGNVLDLAGNPLPAVEFTQAAGYNPALHPIEATLADVNGDGKLDLLTPDTGLYVGGQNVFVQLGNGDGTFGAPTSYATGTSPWSIAVGDLNGDGKVDLAVANADSNSVSILYGNGDGTFQTQNTVATGNYPTSVAIGDFNGDGKPDLAVADFNSFAVSVLLNDGNGSFSPQPGYAIGPYPYTLAAADLNGDGKTDLIVGNRDSNVSVLLGNGDGTFQAPKTYDPVSPGAASIAVADVNGDGVPDLIVGGSQASVMLGNGDGTFGTAVGYYGNGGGRVATADINGDGKLDIVLGAQILLGNGDGTFQASSSFAGVGSVNGDAAADLNGDGRPDFVFANYNYNYDPNLSTVTVFLNNTPPFTIDKTTPYTIDKTAPQVSLSLDHSQLNLAAETAVVTFAFSEAVTGFGLTSVTASGGSLSNLQTSDGGKTYTATFTAANGVDVANADVGVNAGGYQDLAGNAGSAGDIGSFMVDTVTPTVAVSVSSSNLTLSARTATVTFSFSEAPVSFALANAAVVGGALSNLQKVNATTYTATFAAAANTQIGNASVSVTGNSWQEGNGNPGTGGTTGNFSVDTYDHWANAAGGSWSTASNWGNGVPTASVAAEIDRAGTYTVTISGPAAAYGLIVNDAGATVSDKNSALTLAGAGGSNGALTITAGTFALNGGSLNAGAVSIGSSGTFLVGSSAALAETFSDNGSLIVANTSTVSFTGKLSGSGSVTVKNSSVATFSGTITGSETFTVDNSAKAIITKAIGGTGSFTLMKGGGLEFVSSDSENVTFASGASGTLKLDNSSTFTGKISGLTPNNAVDLADLAYTKAKNMLASYTGNTAGGVLTVGNGSKSVSLNLLGDYTHSTWTLSKDASGGTLVVDPATETPWPEPGLVASSTLDLLSNASGPNSILGFARHGDSILDTLAGANEHIGPDVALLVNYMASAFPMSSGGYGGALTDPSQPAISQHMLLSLPQHT